MNGGKGQVRRLKGSSIATLILRMRIIDATAFTHIRLRGWGWGRV